MHMADSIGSHTEDTLLTNVKDRSLTQCGGMTSEQSEGGQVERQAFRFRTWRPSRPPNMLRVDEAIDRVGMALFPEEWGRHAHFGDLPHFWRRGRTGIYRLEAKGKGFTRVDIAEQTPEIIDQIDMFQLAYRMLRKGLRNDIEAVAVT